MPSADTATPRMLCMRCPVLTARVSGPGHPIDPEYPRFAPQAQGPDPEFEECARGHQNRLFHYASVLASFLWRPNEVPLCAYLFGFGLVWRISS
eukprot:3404454-Rhodomonas_salina.4